MEWETGAISGEKPIVEGEKQPYMSEDLPLMSEDLPLMSEDLSVSAGSNRGGPAEGDAEDVERDALSLLSCGDPLVSLMKECKKMIVCTGEDAYIRGEDLYFGRNGVERDTALAVKYYEQAAWEGNPRALYALALCYLEGEGVARSEAEGIRLLKKAAKELPDACYFLGKLYFQGRYLVKNDLLASFWLQEALHLGDHPLAKRLLERIEMEEEEETSFF